MYIKPIPVGVNPPLDEDRMAVWRATSGDDLFMTTRLTLLDGTTPVSPENSKITSNCRRTASRGPRSGQASGMMVLKR